MTMPGARTDTRDSAPELDPAFEAELEAMALQVAAPIEDPREPALPRYLKWQARDYAKHRGVWLFGIALVGVWIFHHMFGLMIDGRAQRHASGVTPEFVTMVFRSVAMGGGMLLGGLGSLMSVGGLVSREREGGHQRFLFAKPVRVASYYLQALGVSAVGLLSIVALVMLITSAVFLRAVPLGPVLLSSAVTFASVGGLTFLLSTLVRFDLALGLLLAIVSIPLHLAAREGRWWAVLTAWLLPPLQKLEAFGTFVSAQQHAQYTVVDAVGSLLVYGAAYIAAGVAVLKRRSIIS